MAITKQSHVGVELNEAEIRIVEVRYRANKPYVVNAGYIALPPGAHAVSHSQGTGSVAVAIRRLLDTMNVDGAQSIVGVSGERTVLRNIAVPPVPDAELEGIVAGEVEHYGIVHSRGGAYAFLRHASPDRKDEAEPIHVTVFAVEETATAAIKEGAEKAGLGVAALEPTSIGMLRTVLLSAGASSSVFALMLGSDSCEMAFVKEGSLMVFRRLDTGTQAILEPAPVLTRRGLRAKAEPEPLGGGEAAAPILDPGAMTNLAREVRQTIDYIQRLYPDAEDAQLYVAVDRSESVPLVEELGHRLSLTVELAGPGMAEEPSGTLAELLSSPEGLRYSAAYGLATHRSAQALGGLPRLDLFASERTTAGKELVRRNLVGSLAISAAALLFGVAGFFLYGVQVSEVEKDVERASVRLRSIAERTAVIRDANAKRANQYETLRREGVPITAIMDYLVQSLESNVGLRDVNISERSVTIIGEARSETALFQTVRKLQQSPVLSNLMIGSFSKATDGSGITFVLSCKSASMDRVRLPGEERQPR